MKTETFLLFWGNFFIRYILIIKRVIVSKLVLNSQENFNKI